MMRYRVRRSTSQMEMLQMEDGLLTIVSQMAERPGDTLTVHDKDGEDWVGTVTNVNWHDNVRYVEVSFS